MFAVSATDLAIVSALRSNTLRLVDRVSQTLGNTYVSIEDERGIIEVALSRAEAETRVASAKPVIRL